jgi:hypothetical protein
VGYKIPLVVMKAVRLYVDSLQKQNVHFNDTDFPAIFKSSKQHHAEYNIDAPSFYEGKND